MKVVPASCRGFVQGIEPTIWNAFIRYLVGADARDRVEDW